MNERTFHSSQAHKLDDPERLKWLPPDEIIGHLQITMGSTIADIGAGTGYFSLPLARAVGNEGRIFAVDFQEEMLAIIRKKFSEQGTPSNIMFVKGDASRTGLGKKSCDLVFMANLWHELDDHPEVLKESARILHSHGILAIVDWKADLQAPPGPPAQHRISKEEVQSTLRHNNWSILKALNVGRFSYMILAKRGRGEVGGPEGKSA